ncbi:MAG: hypothetical protein JSS64_01900 [Bacteroidetes bacterium]|nr:hypothetical protein [Bacteroidota bacterium]
MSNSNLYSQNSDSLKTKLEGFFDQSISQRNKIRQVLTSKGQKSIEFKKLNKEISQSDSLILIQVLKILDKYGWLGIDKIGATANEELFLAIQHSNLEIMEKYFPMLAGSAKQKKSSLLDMAKLMDRILIMKGLPQVYGTQYYFDSLSHRFFFYPIDLSTINKKRKSVGLQPLKKYSKLNGINMKKK